MALVIGDLAGGLQRLRGPPLVPAPAQAARQPLSGPAPQWNLASGGSRTAARPRPCRRPGAFAGNVIALPLLGAPAASFFPACVTSDHSGRQDGAQAGRRAWRCVGSRRRPARPAAVRADGATRRRRGRQPRMTAAPYSATMVTVRKFNTEGPVVAADHYHIPPLERMDIDAVLGLVRDKKHFVLHARASTSGPNRCAWATSRSRRSGRCWRSTPRRPGRRSRRRRWHWSVRAPPVSRGW